MKKYGKYESTEVLNINLFKIKLMGGHTHFRKPKHKRNLCKKFFKSDFEHYKCTKSQYCKILKGDLIAAGSPECLFICKYFNNFEIFQIFHYLLFISTGTLIQNW